MAACLLRHFGTATIFAAIFTASCGTLYADGSAGEKTGEQEQNVGRRPYEMDWASRTQDTHPALVDFENLDGWTVETHHAAAMFSLSREQQLWGKYVGRLTYRGTGDAPVVTLRPPKPIPIATPFDCANFWIYGNNWAWVPARDTPQVDVRLLVRPAVGDLLRIDLGRVNWREWWVMHRRLTPAQVEQTAKGAQLEGIEIVGGTNEKDRTLYFDNLAFYQETLKPLHYDPRPRRGIDLPEGQSVGTNVGPGRLPFPTREQTILPDNLTKKFHVALKQDGDVYEFIYQGDDGRLVYRYTPKTGTLSDVTASWNGGPAFRPFDGGGLRFADKKKSTEGVPAERVELFGRRCDSDAVVTRWRGQVEGKPVEYTYAFRLWQKSLVVDVACRGGEAVAFRFGQATGVERPRVIPIPYLAGDVGRGGRPQLLTMGPADHPLFLMGLVDHCRTNASVFWFASGAVGQTAFYNGGTRYTPKTDGRRNDCFERIFLTVSPRVEEVLPNVPNPTSPWMAEAGRRVWNAHGAGNRAHDLAFWTDVARHGMSEVLVTDHETGWRDGGESFTMRTRAAPGKGGDEGQAAYADAMHKLGFRYGIYNNYTDYAPVNEFWNEDWVTRQPDGDWQRAWARCYNPKPARAVEAEAKLAPIIEKKFHLDTAYCDVHTCVTPWQDEDYDARTPGAATLAGTFYAYGEIMLHQKKTWNGPVYSEGGNHWYYCGLTDGNYGQDQSSRLDINPWLVDFDLRKLHPLCCNFGMGNPGMFFGKKAKWDNPKAGRLDEFLAATLAFGHTGFLVAEGNMADTVRSYFDVQQIHARYATQTIADIFYADADGRLCDSSHAIANGVYKRRQLVTRYADGLEIAVNGDPTDDWTIDGDRLPPFGWTVRDPKVQKLEAWSKLVDGRRADYVDSPAYLYADGRGKILRCGGNFSQPNADHVQKAKIVCDGQLIALRRDGGRFDLIPMPGCKTFGVSTQPSAAKAEAFDRDGKSLGAAETRISRGVAFVMPVKDAFRYRLTPGDAPATRPLECSRTAVTPGETVIAARGDIRHKVVIPADAKPGHVVWRQVDGDWLDFEVVPPVETQLAVHGDRLRLTVVSHLPHAADAKITLDGVARDVSLTPEKPTTVDFANRYTSEPGEHPTSLEIVIDGRTVEKHQWRLVGRLQPLVLKTFATAPFQALQQLRGEKKPSFVDSATGATVAWMTRPCGGVEKHCLFIHPPYQHKTGCAMAAFEPIALPADAPMMFRGEIGRADGSVAGDGVLFRVVVCDTHGQETVAAEDFYAGHAWKPIEADLSRWQGQTVHIKLISDAGPKDNPSGDWSCWAEMRVESQRPVVETTVDAKP